MSDLRPTLFLAQLPNLLAGNISIVHGVVGSSRTFMGEEAAGVDAVRVAHARIAAGQSELTLVGGAYNGTRWDVLLILEQAGALLRDAFAPIWDRGPAGGIALASMGAFLVLESREHAQARGARPRALVSVQSDRNRASPARSKPRFAGSGMRSRPRSTATAPLSFPAPRAWNRRRLRSVRAHGDRPSGPQQRDVYRSWPRGPVSRQYRHWQCDARTWQTVRADGHCGYREKVRPNCPR